MFWKIQVTRNMCKKIIEMHKRQNPYISARVLDIGKSIASTENLSKSGLLMYFDPKA